MDVLKTLLLVLFSIFLLKLFIDLIMLSGVGLGVAYNKATEKHHAAAHHHNHPAEVVHTHM